MARREREILEHAVHTVAEQAMKADDLVDEAKAAGGGDHPVTVHAKMLRLELLNVKADLERELEDFSSTAPSAAWTCIGCLGSACHQGIGRIESQRRTASRPFEGGACIRRGSRLAWTGSSDVDEGGAFNLRIHWALARAVNCRVVSAIRLRSFVGVGREGYIGYGA
jgi:hypothetical protein